MVRRQRRVTACTLPPIDRYAALSMRPGVVGLLPGDPAAITADHARRIRAQGFTGVSVQIKDLDSFREEDLRRVRTVLAAEGVRVAQANASYPALVHPDETQRAEGVRLARLACRAARALDQGFRRGSGASGAHGAPVCDFGSCRETFSAGIAAPENGGDDLCFADE